MWHHMEEEYYSHTYLNDGYTKGISFEWKFYEINLMKSISY